MDVTDDKDDIPLSAMTTPVSQPVSFGLTWIDSQRIALSPIQMGTSDDPRQRVDGF